MSGSENEGDGEGGKLKSSQVANVDENGNGNGNDPSSASALNSSSISDSTSAATSSSTISVTSETELKLGGKLFEQFTTLQQTYTRILTEIESISLTKNQKSNDRQPGTAFLTNDQVNKLCSDSKLKAPVAKKLLGELVNAIRPICLPSYKLDNGAQHSVKYSSDVESVLTRVEKSMVANRVDVSGLERQLAELTSKFANGLADVRNSKSPCQPPQCKLDIPDVGYVDLDISPHEEKMYDSNFLSAAESSKLVEALGKLEYTEMNGRGVVKFGENYNFHGSREDAVTPSSEIADLMRRVNSTVVPQDAPLVNSVVATRYRGPESGIPVHQDNERSLQHDSFIYTITVVQKGKDRSVKFSNTQSGESTTLTPVHGSLYVMSRKSNDVFKHCIESDDSLDPDDIRYSLTLRTAHWRNNKSTIILGDSNARDMKFAEFGYRRDTPSNKTLGTFGHAMPGTRELAYHVAEIDPTKCTGYNNVVIQCALNDLRKPEVKSDDDIGEIYRQYKVKVAQIKELNRTAKLYSCPMMPTGDFALNLKLQKFNLLLFSDLKYALGVTIISGISKFQNPSTRCLRSDLKLDREGDVLHINEKGRGLLCSLIKDQLFQRKFGQGKDKQNPRRRATYPKSGGSTHAPS